MFGLLLYSIIISIIVIISLIILNIYDYTAWQHATYYTFPSTAIPAIIIYPFFIIIATIVGRAMLKASKYMTITSKKKSLISLGLCHLFSSMGTLSHELGLITFYIIGVSGSPVKLARYEILVHPLSLMIASILGILSFLFLYLFGLYEFRGEERIFDYVIVFFAMAVIILIPNPYNWWGLIEPLGAFCLRKITNLLMLIFGLIATINVAFPAYRNLKVAIETLLKLRIKLIILSIVMMFIFFAFIMLDAFLGRHYTIYVSFAWLFLTISVILMYIAMLGSDTLVRRILIREK